MEGAKTQWEEQKASGQVVSGGEGRYLLDDNYVAKENSAGTKRKRDEPHSAESQLQRELEDEEEDNTPAAKRPRKQDVPEVADSYPHEREEWSEEPKERRRSSLVVELALPYHFDRSAYQAVQASQTGSGSSSAGSETSFLEHPEDLIEASSSIADSPAQRVKKVAGRFIVPDSQDFPQASASWEPSQGLQSTSTTEFSHIDTQPEEEEDSLLPEVDENASSHSHYEDGTTDESTTESGETAPEAEVASASASSIVDFGIAPQSTASLAPASSLVAPLQHLPVESSPLRFNSVSASPQSSPIRSLLTPTRQQPRISSNQSSSPSSQILRGSDRNSQANSSGQSQQQLPSPTAERSRSNSAGSSVAG